jgi:hypothetical protein
MDARQAGIDLTSPRGPADGPVASAASDGWNNAHFIAWIQAGGFVLQKANILAIHIEI